MIFFDAPGTENGYDLRIRFWQVAQAIAPTTVRLVQFSYTVLAEHFDDPEFVATIDLLHREITSAELAPMRGL
jgi:hypothetical protein